MQIFKKPNIDSDWKCPICNTNGEKEVTLIPILGTREGNIIQAEQIHLDCINLTYDKEHNILYQKL